MKSSPIATGTSWRIAGEVTVSPKISTSGTGWILVVPAYNSEVPRLRPRGGAGARAGADCRVRRGAARATSARRRDLRRLRAPGARHRRVPRRLRRARGDPVDVRHLRRVRL